MGERDVLLDQRFQLQHAEIRVGQRCEQPAVHHLVGRDCRTRLFVDGPCLDFLSQHRHVMWSEPQG